LTTKFTQHTQERFQLLANSLQLKPNSNTPLKFYGPLSRSTDAKFQGFKVSKFQGFTSSAFLGFHLETLEL